MHRVFAQELNIPGGQISGPDGFAFHSVGKIIEQAIPYIFAFAGIGLLLMIISAGLTLMTSAGDTKKLESGKQRLNYAIVGFLIIFISYWAVQLTGKMFALTEILSVFQ